MMRPDVTVTVCHTRSVVGLSISPFETRAGSRAEASPLLLAATRCAIVLAEARGWSAATIAGVFYGLKAARSTWAQLSSRAIPALSPRRRVRANLPGCRYPEVAARQG